MNALTSLVKRHPLVTFFVLAYALAWWPSLLLLAGVTFPLPQFDTGPFLAALLVSAIIEGRQGVKALLGRLVLWRVGLTWYAVALLLPALLIVAAVALSALLGAPAPTAEQLSRWPRVVFFFLLFLVLPIAAPLGEEPGWRGFAQLRLMQGRSALMASLILGVLWASWHLPLIVIWKISSWALIPLVIPSAIIMTWIYLHTRGSVLLALIYHASFDAVTNLVAEIYPGAELVRVTWVLAVVFWIAALTVIVVTGPSLMRKTWSTEAEAGPVG